VPAVGRVEDFGTARVAKACVGWDLGGRDLGGRAAVAAEVGTGLDGEAGGNAT
jgi:hypothetical protein